MSRRPLLILLSVPLLALILACGGSATPDKAEAWVMAQNFVKDRLKSPATADFGSAFSEHQSYEKCVEKTGKNTFTAKGWVDAQNAFGAKVRTDFVCKLRYDGDDKWVLEAIDMRQR